MEGGEVLNIHEDEVIDEEFLVIKQEPVDYDEEGDDYLLDEMEGANWSLSASSRDLMLRPLTPQDATKGSCACNKCGKVFKNFKSLTIHCQNIHPITQCYVCQQELETAKGLQDHLTGHSAEERLACRVCGRSYSTADQVKNHLKSHLSEEELKKDGVSYWSCYFCQKKVFRYAELVDHFPQHTMEKRYKCKHCKKAYVSAYGLFVHNRNDHLGKLAQARAKWKNICPHCNQKFRTPSCLKIHLPKHSDERAFVCSDCQKSFKFRTEWVAHQKIHEDVCKYECQECGLRTTSSWKLKQHSYAHSSRKPFECQECSKAFKQKATLDKHVRTMHLELEKRDWKCSVCKKSLTSELGLKKHSLLHQLEDKGFACKICGKKMATEKRLSAHIARHSGNREFVCPFPGCGNSYTEIANLRRHQKATHEGMRRHCDVEGCDKSFTGPVSLRNHKSSAHGIGDSIKCDVEWCDEEFPSKQWMAQHMKIAHSIGKMKDKCLREGCGKAFPNSLYLKHHMRGYHKVDWVYDKESKSWREEELAK